MPCGQSFYQDKKQHITRDQTKIFKYVFAGVAGCMKGCGEEYARDQLSINPEISSLELFLYSGYGGKVDIGGCVLDQYRAISDQIIRIKVIDAKEHSLDMNKEYTTKYLASLNPITVDSIDNEYLKLCTLLAFCHIRRLEEHLISEKVFVMLHLILESHRERMSEEYPQLLHTNTEYTLNELKELYHGFLTRLVPIDIFHNVYQYLLFIYETVGIISVGGLDTIVCIANVENLENAYWTGKYAVFGNGHKLFYPLASIDVIGHELSHGLVDGISGLKYRGHSGALNESYADVFGSMFEFYMYRQTELIGDSDWFIGADIIKTGEIRNLRNMADPHKSYTPQPREYEGKYYVDPSSSFDFGGVHINSGISNHCFYLIATTVSAIIALELYFDCLHRLKSTCTYKEFAKHLRISSVELGYDSQVNNCLDNVNLPIPKKVVVKPSIFQRIRQKLVWKVKWMTTSLTNHLYPTFSIDDLII